MAPPREKKVCYIILSARSLIWFLLSVLATMLIMISLFSPHWLIAESNPSQIISNNVSVIRYPSFGLSSRCKKLSSGKFECATFALTTSTEVFPFFWKLAYCFMCLSFSLLCITTLCALISFCRQSFMGKSLHTVTGSLQILSMIFALISMFLYPMGWNVERITSVCIDLSPFYPGECSLGYSFYSAIAGIIVAMICGILSLKAEKSTMNPSIKKRIEEGNERLVFAK